MRKFDTFLLCICCAIFFTGCTNQPELPESSVNMVILAGKHNNSKNININLEDEINGIYSLNTEP